MLESIQRRLGATGAGRLEALQHSGRHAELISRLRRRLQRDSSLIRDPWVKSWCAQRFRNIFIGEAAADPGAVAAARRKLTVPATDIALPAGPDRRPERQKVAERFLHEHAEEWQLELPAPSEPETHDTTLVFCPGLINSMLPIRAFASSFPAIAERGRRVICADAHPLRGCEDNIADLLAAIEEGRGLDHDCEPIAAEDAEPPGDVFLLCYSKGAADALTMLAARPDLAERIRAIFMWAGAIGGSHLADDIHEQLSGLDLPVGQMEGPVKAIAKAFFPAIGFEGAVSRMDEHDIETAVRDLTTTRRDEFLAEHGARFEALGIPTFSITGATRLSEVPYFQMQGVRTLNRHDPDNDMQLTQAQARLDLPISTHLATMRAHHWDLSYDPFPLHTRMGAAKLTHPFPRTAALTAIFKFSAELGLID